MTTGMPFEGAAFFRMGTSVQLLSSVAGALQFSDPRPRHAAMTSRAVQRDVFRETGFRPGIIVAATACRGASDSGLLRVVDDDLYEPTDAGWRLRQEMLASARAAMQLFTEAISRVLGERCKGQPPGHMRQLVMTSVGHLVTGPLRRGAFFRAEDLGGLLPLFDNLSDETLDAAISIDVPPALRALVKDVLRVALSGDDPVLAMMIAHVTSIRFCDLVIRGHLRDPAEADDNGRALSLWALFETSAMVAMVETPARWAEGYTCLLDAATAGHRVAMLQVTVEEYLTGLDGAERKIEKTMERVADDEIGIEALQDPKQPWYVRALEAYGEVPNVLGEGMRKGRFENLKTVAVFVERLRAVPGKLRRAGVKTIDGESVSPERYDQWRRGMLHGKNRRGDGVAFTADHPQVVHDAVVLATLESRLRREPHGFIVSVDDTMSCVYDDVVRERSLDRLPGILYPAVACSVFANVAPAPTRTLRDWLRLSMFFGLAARHVESCDPASTAAEGSPFEDDLLIADEGPRPRPDSHPRRERVRRLITESADLAEERSRRVDEMADGMPSTDAPGADDAGAATAPPADAAAPAPRVGVWRSRVARAARRRARVIVVIVVALVVTAIAAGFLPYDDAVARLLRSWGTARLRGDQVLALGVGGATGITAYGRYRQHREVATLGLDLLLIALAVWSVAFVVID